jgi:hypothetical protein
VDLRAFDPDDNGSPGDSPWSVENWTCYYPAVYYLTFRGSLFLPLVYLRHSFLRQDDEYQQYDFSLHPLDRSARGLSSRMDYALARLFGPDERCGWEFLTAPPATFSYPGFVLLVASVGLDLVESIEAPCSALMSEQT